MNVGVRASERIPAMLAHAARQRIRADTEQALTEPERQTLLANARRAMQEQ